MKVKAQVQVEPRDGGLVVRVESTGFLSYGVVHTYSKDDLQDYREAHILHWKVTEDLGKMLAEVLEHAGLFSELEDKG